VTAGTGSSLVLIVDRDLGFLMWLGELFTELGFQAVPALQCRHALQLAGRLELSITTLVVNPDLPGAQRMVQSLLASNPGARVILIRDSAAAGDSGRARDRSPANPATIQAESTLERPAPWERISRPDWLARVRKALMRAHSP